MTKPGIPNPFLDDMIAAGIDLEAPSTAQRQADYLESIDAHVATIESGLSTDEFDVRRNFDPID